MSKKIKENKQSAESRRRFPIRPNEIQKTVAILFGSSGIVRFLSVFALFAVFLASTVLAQTPETSPSPEAENSPASAESQTVQDEEPATDQIRRKRTSETNVNRTEVAFGYSFEHLTNGYGDWKTASLDIMHKFTQRKVLYGSYIETERFGRRDRQAQIGFYQPLSEKWTLLVEGNASPTHKVLARFSAMAQIERSVGRGLILQGGYRRTEMNDASINVFKFGAEKYWGLNRAAYSFQVNNLQLSGTSVSQRLQYNRYYGRFGSSAGIGLAFGREIENIGASRLLQSDVVNITANGKHWFSNSIGADWRYTFHRQGELYDRSGLSVGIRFVL
ncbi:MAG: YaiO family outer membrane beta-barrel protein [Pyrinomonadaceae bacterium]